MRDSLRPDVVLPLLRGRFGRPYLFLDRCESTQLLLAADAPEGAVAAADEQTAGRGRLGRRWYAPAGTSLLVSVQLRPDVPGSHLPELSLVAGGAVAEAIEAMAGVAPTVKFPNDVLVGGRKVAGVLAEARDGRVVLGVGVNVNVPERELPTDVETPATSLAAAAGRELDRAELLAELLERLERRYDAWLSVPRPCGH